MKRLMIQAMLTLVTVALHVITAQAEGLPGTVTLVEQDDDMNSRVYAYVRAETEPIFDMDEQGISFDRDPVLAFICEAGEIVVVYKFDTELMGKNDAVRVKFRLDEQRFSKRQMWPLNHDPSVMAQMQAGFAAMGVDPANPLLQMVGNTGIAAKMPQEHANDFLEAASAADRVTIRVTDPIDRESHTDVFPLDGFGVVIDRLSQVCSL